MSRMVATILDIPLQAWCFVVCRPDRPGDIRLCAYEFVTGGPNPFRRLLWWITDHSYFWRTP